MTRQGRAVFAALVSLVLALLIVRACLVPITHDEARTYFIYVLTGEFLPWASFWDAGNHIVCSALGWLSFHLTGMSPLSLRTGNLLAFVLYAFYSWRLGVNFKSPVVRWCCWMALLLTPAFLEFFALFRGYGLAFAFMLLSVHHHQCYVERKRMPDLIAALVGWTLAGWSMLSLSLVWCAAVTHLSIITFFPGAKGRGGRRQVLVCLLLGYLPLIAALVYGMELGARGALYDGTEVGLFDGTYRLLLNTLFRVGYGPYFTWSTALLVGTFFFTAALIIRDHRSNGRTLLTLVLGLLLAEFSGRYALWYLADVRFPMGRTALHWVPLMVLSFALAFDRLAQWHRYLAALALPLLVLPWQTITTFNVTHASVWPVDALSKDLLRSIEAKQKRAGRPLLIDGDEQLDTQWDHSRQWQGLDLPPVSHKNFPQPVCDLILLDTLGYTPPPGFLRCNASDNGRQVLYKREQPLSFDLLGDSATTQVGTTEEFIGLPWPNMAAAKRSDSALEFALVVLSPERSLTARLVIEVADSLKNHLHYEVLELRQLQRGWSGDTLHFLRRVPPVVDARATGLIYIWNPDRQDIAVPSARIRAFRINTEQTLNSQP